MAKKDNKATRTKLEEVNEQLSGGVQKIEENKKLISWILGGIIAVGLLGWGYWQFIHIPSVKKAEAMVNKGDMEAMVNQNDSLALIEYQKAAKAGNNRAKLMQAQLLYGKKKYAEAAKLLEDYNPGGDLVAPASQSLLGDCYVNLKKLDKAIAAFDKAITLSGDNPDYTPIFLMKKAAVLRENKKFADEAAIYQTITDKYPNFAQAQQLEKYLERAKAQSGK